MIDTGRSTLRRSAALLALLLSPAAVSSADAQRDSATVTAGAHYAASGLKATLLGPDYRDFWATPIRVPVLDLRSYGGGLTATETGGGNQTISLRFTNAAGREFAFRSVEKYPRLADEPALANTVIGALVQDQVSSLHPAAGLMVPPIMEAIGVLHPTPTLVVMPDDPALGEFRQQFAGMLGTIEERPDERDAEDPPGFGGFRVIVDTEELFEMLEEEPGTEFDARGYLTARLADMLIGDWDRHADQWRWAAEPRGGRSVFRPIARDRDYAFVDYDGLLMTLGRAFVPNAVRFTKSFNMVGLTLNMRDLDHRLLTELERPVWDSVTAFIQSRVTDAVIADAVSRVPREFIGPVSEDIAATLRWRRDNLGIAAEQFYALVTTEVDVRGTDEADLALVERGSDGGLRVRLFSRPAGDGPPSGEPFFERTFREEETHEVRVYLHGGDDRAVVRGGGETPYVRLVGGGGDDVLVDSSGIRGLTAIHDDRGENTFVRGPGTVVDTREYEPPPGEPTLSGESFRDWGSLWSYTPSINYQSTDGVILGFGRSYTRFGFRKEPYEFQVAAGGEVGLGNGAVALRVTGDFRRNVTRDGFLFDVEASQLDPIHFYGFGNDTEATESSDFYVVRQNRLTGLVSMYRGLGTTGRLSLGPIVKFTRTQLPTGTPFAAAHDGSRNFGQLGAQSRLVLDTRDAVLFPRRGAVLEVAGSAYPAVWDVDGAFGEVNATARAYYTPADSGWSPTLAVRVGGKKLWGEFPIHESAYLGGSATVRGHSFERFAGDAMVFGNAEARVPLMRMKLFVRGDLGALGLVDAGRVYFDGESPGDWHTAYGGGLWFRFQIRSSLIATSASYAQGEKGTLYLKLGLPF